MLMSKARREWLAMAVMARGGVASAKISLRMPQVNTNKPRREDGSGSIEDRDMGLLIRRRVPAKFRQ